ncbi:hypothetical protein R9C00_20880 [Flammeovirgaceae bacterium SG7u.111]|nr:hypothetical protein [Flammeovirgaceae bacterium SG7u.132]WPO34156.1 hypothetical protein R9C00_20880 [Flammeovirgaceae bacterium SG7u.111]
MNKEKLYDAFGELLYATFKVEGAIRGEVLVKLEESLAHYNWGAAALWSFNYEQDHNRSIEDAFDKAYYTFEEFGPNEEYATLFSLLERLSNKKHYISKRGRVMIEKFKRRLNKKFSDRYILTMAG